MFSKMKLGTKILTGFIVISLITATLGIVGIINIKRIEDADTKMFEENVIGLEIIGSISQAFLRTRVNVNQAIAERFVEDANIQETLSKIKEFDAEITKEMGLYEKAMKSEEEKKLYSALKLNLEKYNEVRDKLIQAIKAGDKKETMRLLDFAVKQGIVTNDIIDKNTELNQKEAKERSHANIVLADNATYVSIIFCVIAFIIAIGLGVLIARNIAGIIGSLLSEAKNLTQAAVAGKLSTRAEADKVNFEVRPIVEGVNDCLDAVIGPLNVAAEYVDRISKGDIPQKISDSYNGDFNEIKNNLNNCIDAVNYLVADANMLSVAAVEGKLATRADATKHNGDFKKIVSGVNDCLDAVIGPLNVAAEYVDRIAKGDIPKKITDNYNGDFNEIKNNLNQCIDATNQQAKVAQAIADGDFTVKVDIRSENDELPKSLANVMKVTQNLQKEMARLTDASKEGLLSERGKPEQFKGAFAELVTGVNVMLDAILIPIGEGNRILAQVSNGKIDEIIMQTYKGDHEAMKQNINNIALVLQEFQKEFQRLTIASENGMLSERGKPEQFKGAYADVIKGANVMLDAILIPIGEGNRILAQVSNGKIDELIMQTYKGDHEAMKQNINNIAIVLQEFQKEFQRLTIASENGMLSERGKPEQFKGAYADVIKGANVMLDAILLPIGEGNRILSLIRGGNLREKVEIACKGDHEAMKNAINGVHLWLSDLIAYVTKIANGDMTAEMAKASKDDQIHQWLIQMRDNISALVADANMLSVAAVEGKLATRADASKHQGDFRKIVQGVDDCLDAVIGPLNVAAEYVDRIAKGDIPKKITDNYNGDFNEIKNNLNMCIDAVNLLVADANMLSVAAVEGKLATRADASKHQGDFSKIVQGVDDCLDAVIGPLNVAAEYVDRISKGDIPKKITDNYNGDFNEIKNNLNILIEAMDTVTSIAKEIAGGNLMVKAAKRSDQDELMLTLIKMIEDLTNFAVNVQGSAQQVATGSEQMSSATEQISQTATEQSANVEEVTSSMEEMNSSVLQNADNARQTTAIAEKAANDAFEGGKAVNETVKAMKSISEKIGIIEAIAAQTNMLALNAAIEAARAGEHGKGFAVVASEVRNLAERSKTAAKEISSLSQSSVEVAERAGNLINDMVPQIKKTSDLVQEINASSKEQATGIEQVTKAIEQLDRSIQQNTSATEEMAGTSVELSSQAEDLQKVAAFFKVDKSDSKYSKKSAGGASITKNFSDKKEIYAANKKSSNVSSAKPQESSDKKGVSIDLGSHEDANFERI